MFAVTLVVGGRAGKTGMRSEKVSSSAELLWRDTRSPFSNLEHSRADLRVSKYFSGRGRG